MLGAEPLDLPSPLDDLVHQLADNRRGHAVAGHTDNHPWLFPGGAPGRPITAAHLMTRLHPLGIQARVARRTVLMDLAAQLPPFVLSKLLGIHIGTATNWAH
ncbi:MAG: hypothetical protein GEU98_24030 [Pseudonocardiaceae bacterium]|nr:hypothetical protein [Pseudonocardiaceae bacterium]